MTSAIAPHGISPEVISATADALPPRQPRKRRSIGVWLDVVIDGLIESYITHTTYARLIKNGVEPSTAVRMAFDVACKRREPGGIIHGNGTPPRAEEQDP